MEVIVDDLKINYISKGNGRTVLILPGWGTIINTYTPLINYISKYANVVVLDMPGFGKSDTPNKSWNLDDYVSFVQKFILKLGIKDLDLIGHSNGGRIICKLMSNKLNFNVGKIILIGSAGIVHKPTLKQKMKVKTFKLCKKIVLLKPIKKIFPNLLDKLQSYFGSQDYKNASPIMRGSMVKLINEDVRNYLPNIKSPTLLLWGEKDSATPVFDAKIMESLIPDVGLVVIPECTHYVFLENPTYVNIIIKNFLMGGINENNS